MLVRAATGERYDAEHVGRSVARAIDANSYYPCREQDGAIVCEMRGLGLPRYVVRRTENDCWRAELERVSGARASAWRTPLEGCVRDSDGDYPARPYD